MEKRLLPESLIIDNIFKNSPCEVCVIDTSYRLVFISERFINNNPLFNSQGLKLGTQILPKDNTQEEWKNYFDIVFNGSSIVVEKNYFIDDLEKYDLIRLIPLNDFEKNTIGCIIYIEDILPLKKSEKVLLAEKKKYSELFENNLASIVVTDAYMNFVHCNNAMLQLSKIDFNSVLQYNAEDFFIGEPSSEICMKLEEIRKGDIHQFTLFEKFKDGVGNEIYGHIAVSGIYKNEIFAGCIITMIDISSQIEAKEKRKEIEELKLREELNELKQTQLSNELDHRNRELFTNLLQISKQNNLLKSLQKELKRIRSIDEDNIKTELNKLNSLIRSQIVFDENWEKTKVHFEQIHPNFFEKVRDICSQLTEKELRHCAYIKMGLSNKETAQLLHVRPKTIEMARYRIRKKIRTKLMKSLSTIFNEL